MTRPHAGDAPAATWPVHRRHVEPVWGTVVTFDVRVADPSLLESCTEALAECVRWLHEVDRIFSTYRPDSLVSMVRRGLTLSEAAARNPHMAEVVASCARARVLCGAAFDPFVVPGHDGLLGFDPSGLVKGWAAGKAADLLEARGFADVMVNAGGDVVVRGSLGGEPWIVAVVDPTDNARPIAALRVTDGWTVATSGLAERGAHIVDPASGEPSTSVISATVVGDDAGLADALATGVQVRGERAAQWLEKRPGWAMFVVNRDGSAWSAGSWEAMALGEVDAASP